MFQCCMRRQNRIVRLDYSGRHLRSWVNSKLKFGLLAIIHAQPLHEQGCKTGSGATAEGVEDEEALETC